MFADNEHLMQKIDRLERALVDLRSNDPALMLDRINMDHDLLRNDLDQISLRISSIEMKNDVNLLQESR